MNIRDWFGFVGELTASSNVNESIEKLLHVYSMALKTYFSVQDAKDYTEIMDLNPDTLNAEQQHFLSWLNNKGFNYLKEIASTNFTNDATLDAMIQYDLYILEEEMDFKYPTDVMSSLISIVNDFPNYIAATSEIDEDFNIYSYPVQGSGKINVEHDYVAHRDIANYISATVHNQISTDTDFSLTEYIKISLPETYSPKVVKSKFAYIIEEVDNFKLQNKEPELFSGSLLWSL